MKIEISNEQNRMTAKEYLVSKGIENRRLDTDDTNGTPIYASDLMEEWSDLKDSFKTKIIDVLHRRLSELRQENAGLREAAQHFVDMVDAERARTVEGYYRFKQALKAEPKHASIMIENEKPLGLDSIAAAK